jgi:hypothetical protein
LGLVIRGDLPLQDFHFVEQLFCGGMFNRSEYASFFAT